MKRIKALIITYYWPPSGGAGVQRWLKFSQYLPSNNVDVIIYTPSNPEMPVVDSSLENEVRDNITVLKQPIWEPYSWYKKFIGAKKSERINAGFLSERKKSPVAEKISVWMRGNFFIPDARCFWIKPSIKYLMEYLRENPVDIIISTGPPHSMHMIALGIKKQLDISWIADFRDPWTRIDYYHQLMLTQRSHNKHLRMEHEVCTWADKLIVVGQQMKLELDKIFQAKAEVIHNGYDEKDIPLSVPKQSREFVLMHVGSLVPTRNPHTLWNVLSQLCKSDDAFSEKLRIHLVGKTDVSVIESIRQCGLESKLIQTDYLKHKEVLQLASSASVLLLLLNDTPNAKGILTGKMFEYIALRKPILCIGPEDGDAARIIIECNAGTTVGFSENEKMYQVVQQLFLRYKSNTLSNETKDASKFSRENLSKKLADIMFKVVNK